MFDLTNRCFGAQHSTQDQRKQKLVAARSPISSGIRLSVPQAKGGQDGKGPVKKRSREEKAQGRKEQKEERPVARTARFATVMAAT
jgi:hypothetical protein